MLKRYSNINYVLKLPLKHAINLINIAQEEEDREIFYRLWLVQLPYFNEESRKKSFMQWYKEQKTNKEDGKSKDELMQELIGAK